MSYARGLILIACFSLIWGVFGGITLVLMKLAGMSLGVLSFALSVVIGLLGAVGWAYIMDRWLMTPHATEDHTAEGTRLDSKREEQTIPPQEQDSSLH